MKWGKRSRCIKMCKKEVRSTKKWSRRICGAEWDREGEREFRQCTIYWKHQNEVRTGKRKIQKEENPECKREAGNLNCGGNETYIQGGSSMGKSVSVGDTLPLTVVGVVVNFSGRDVFSNEEFDHNALFHAPRYLLSAHHSSNSQTGLNRF